MDLGLRQRDLALKWGLRTETVAGWERGTYRPSIRWWPAITEFLGFDPEEVGEGPAARLEAARRRLGLTRRELGAKVALEAGSMCRWAKGKLRPSPWMAGRIEEILDQLENLDARHLTTSRSYFEHTRWGRKPPHGVRPRTFGERLRARRLQLRLSLDELGRRIGRSRATVNRLERGASRPTLELRERLGAALKRRVSPSKVAPFTNPPASR